MFQNVFSWDHKGGKGPWGGGKSTRGAGHSGGEQPPKRSAPRQTQQPPELDDILRSAEERVKRFMNGHSGGNGSGNKKPLLLGGAVLAVLWLASGFYIVEPDEQGVVLRFGSYVQTTNPGANYHLPWPFETVIKPKVTRENIVEIGFVSAGNSSFRNSRRGGDVVAESLMLTGDENIVDLDFTVRWRIADPRAHLFNVADPEGLIKNAAESVMREIIGGHPIDDALTGNKAAIQTEVLTKLQALLDSYKAGVAVSAVELQQVNPPQQVVDAFRDVQAARADAEKMENEAIGYRNDIVPRARGEAARILEEAQAYKQAKIAQAEGAAQRFESRLAEYRKAKDVTAQRLYLETMEKVMQKTDKVILGGEASKAVLPYLPLNKNAERNGGTK